MQDTSLFVGRTPPHTGVSINYYNNTEDQTGNDYTEHTNNVTFTSCNDQLGCELTYNSSSSAPKCKRELNEKLFYTLSIGLDKFLGAVVV